MRTRLAALPHVAVVAAAQLSAGRDTALINVRYDVPVTYFTDSAGVDALNRAVTPAQRAGVQAELGGFVPENHGTPAGRAEIIGVVVALVILLFAFGSVVVAGVPLAVAMIGLGVGTAGVTLLAAATSVSTFAPTIASMVGIGAGIDYALLLVTRHVEGLRSGLSVRAAAAEATATSGRSVLFAGTAVLVSPLGLPIAGLPVYSSFGYATALVVLAVMATSVTLVPALCGLAGARMQRVSKRARPVQASRTEAWAYTVARRPLPFAIGSLLVLLLLAAPVLGMRIWPQDAGNEASSTTVRRAHDLVAAEYGPGVNGALLLVADLHKVPAASLPQLRAGLARMPGVRDVTAPVVSSGAAVLTVVPTTAPSDVATVHLLERIRASVPDGVGVTGMTAVFADISQRLSGRLGLVIAFVVSVAVLLLTIVFRSIVVALKAAVMNLLSIGAAYGVMTVLFEWGWGVRLLGLPYAMPVSSWAPILMFAVLFGVSMDYEVFLLGRVREDWLRTGDAHGSVARGLGRTGRVITSAAAIMVAVFLGFAMDPSVTIKSIGVGLAVGVFLDATLVRMVLVPATMALLGPANWRVPRRFDRSRSSVAADPEPASELVGV